MEYVIGFIVAVAIIVLVLAISNARAMRREARATKKAIQVLSKPPATFDEEEK